MTRPQARTLLALGIRWRLLSTGKFLISLAGSEMIVSGYSDALAFAADFYGRL